MPAGNPNDTHAARGRGPPRSPHAALRVRPRRGFDVFCWTRQRKARCNQLQRAFPYGNAHCNRLQPALPDGNKHCNRLQPALPDRNKHCNRLQPTFPDRNGSYNQLQWASPNGNGACNRLQWASPNGNGVCDRLRALPPAGAGQPSVAEREQGRLVLVAGVTRTLDPRWGWSATGQHSGLRPICCPTGALVLYSATWVNYPKLRSLEREPQRGDISVVKRAIIGILSPLGATFVGRVSSRGGSVLLRPASTTDMSPRWGFHSRLRNLG